MQPNVKCAHTAIVPIAELKPHPGNENKHSKRQIEALAKIIAKLGQRSPITVSKLSGFISKGHARLEAIKLIGWDSVAVDVQEYKDELEELNDRVADNEIARYSEFQLEKFELNLKSMNLDMKTLDLGEFGLLDLKIQQIDAKDEGEIPGPAVNPVCKPGDLWILGKHRVLCGDATNLTDVEKVMDGKKASLVVTDPPYNVNYSGGGVDGNKLTIKNDHMPDSDFYQFLRDVYVNLFTVMDDGAPIYVFHADTEGVNFRKAMMDAGLKLAQCLVWVKDSLVMGRQDYHWQHEPILYGWKPTGAHKWFTDRKQSTVWTFSKPRHNDVHPTMKPVELIKYPILNSSEGSNSIVVDLFLGSGSTLIASEETGRACYGLELDPRYMDVIVERWEKHTGNKAFLEGETFAEVKSRRIK